MSLCPAVARRAVRASLFSTTAACLALLVSPAAAQEQEGFFQMLGRIVLGTGTAKVAIDTPQAVTALTQADLDRTQATMLSGIFKGVPGIQTAGASARALGQAINIRGIGNSEQSASEERIKVVVDDAPKFFEQYRMGSFFGDVELYKRVEILRGPASSTLYGSGTIGGVVAFTTKDASDFLTDDANSALRFKGSYGSNGNSGGQGVIYAQRVGNLEFLAALNQSSGDDVTDGEGNVIPGTAHDANSALFKAKINFDEDQNLTFSTSRTETQLDDAAVSQTGVDLTAFDFGTADIHSVDETTTLTYRNAFLENPLLDLRVQLSRTDTRVEKDNFSLGAFCAPGTFQVLCEGEFGYRTTALKIENTAELNVGSWENRLTFGTQLSEQDRSAETSLGSMGFHPEGTDEKTAAYVQGEFVWDDRLTIITGARVDNASRTPSDDAIAQGAEKTEDSATSTTLSVMYDVTDQFGLFGTLARTERMPTLDELYSYGSGQLPSLSLDKETAETVELGMTYQHEGLISEGDSLQIKLTGFQNDIDNLIARNTGAGAGTAYFANLRKARIWGGEIEAAYESDHWFAGLAYSKVQSKNLTKGALSDLPMPDTPAANTTLTLGAKLPDQDLTIGVRSLWANSIRVASVTTGAETLYDAYDTQDLFITWAPDEGALQGVAVNLTVENMFDATYRNNLSLDNAPGRNVKLAVTKAFTW